MAAVNCDLQREREKASFMSAQLTYVLYDGAENTRKRRAIENIALRDVETLNPLPLAFASQDEAYSEALRKAIYVQKRIHQLGLTDAADAFYYKDIIMPRENSPIGLHTVMFIPTIVGQGTDEQIEKWIPKALNYEIIGTYAQTEMGHGTFIRGLETTATFDARTDEFVLNSPTLTATKWWPGNLGKTTNFAILLAQLYTKNQCHGIHAFILQTRSLDDHKSMPGVTLGDIGPKMGYITNDNGFMRLEKVRIPRDQMLMKYSQVSRDGTYTRKASSKLTYGSMVVVRALISFDCARGLGQACTIAIRYSAVRRQSEMKPGEREPQVLDYQTQQYKLLPNLATSYALWFAGQAMRRTLMTIGEEIKQGNTDQLAQLHALSAGLKAYSSWVASAGIEECRMSCGGHGYSQSSGLPKIYADLVPACTYEGENTVMMLQVARYLMKCCASALTGQKLSGPVAYLSESHFDQCTISGDSNLDAIVNAYQHRAQRLVKNAAGKLKSLTQQGHSQEVAWNMTAVQLSKAAYAHVNLYVVKNFVDFLKENQNINEEIKHVLTQLCEMYALHGIVEQSGSFLQDGFIRSQQMNQIEARLMALLAEIRPNAVALVDAFDFHDRVLDSVLGRYDGQVYENLYQWAQQSPLNKTDVHDSYYKYLRPLLKSGGQSKL